VPELRRVNDLEAENSKLKRMYAELVLENAAISSCCGRAPRHPVSLPNPGGVEGLVLEGSFEEGGERFEPQSWLRLPVGNALEAQTGPAGCKVWIKAGHLARARNLSVPS
jgi:hypothetical protein